ncbi:Cna B-type domain-containing protein [Carnobacteriaceae bacterium zg-ZUI240]|nr:Cna B-type domain-containing protein [Carnobacteriaceae bacterium zg-ZUI240]
MKKIQKFVSLLMTVALVIGLWPAQVVRAADEGITLTQTQVPSTRTDTREFLTGELMQSVLTFKANLPEAEYTGAYIELSVPSNVASFVESIEPNISLDSEVFGRATKVNATTWRIPLKASNDAREAEIPIFTKFKTYVTPDKTALPITTTLKKADGTVVKTAEPVLFLAKAGGASYRMEIRGGQDQIGGVVTNQQTLATNGLVDVVFDYIQSSNPETPLSYEFTKHTKDEYAVWSNNTGQRLYDTITLTQPLPPFAKFDASKNPNWTYDAGTNTATYTLNRKDYDDLNGYNNVSLVLTFPGANVDTTYMAESTMVFHPKNKGANESDVTQSNSVRYRFRPNSTKGMPFEKHFANEPEDRLDNRTSLYNVTNVASRTSKGVNWRLTVANTASEKITFTEFKDYGLDSRLYYTGVSLPRTDDIVLDHYNGETYANVSNVTVRGVLNDGSQRVLGTVSSGRTLNFDRTIAREIKELYFDFPSDYTLNHNQIVSFTVKSAFRQTPTVSPTESENEYVNSGSYNAIYTRTNGSSYPFSANDTAKFKLVGQKVDIGIEKQLSEKLGTGWFSPRRDEALRSDNEYAIWTLQGTWDNTVKGVDDRTTLTNVAFIDLLPEGVTYERTVLNGGWGAPRPTVTYVPNYNDTGLNAVIIKWNSITVGQLNRYMDNSDAIQILTKVTSNSVPGHNTNYVLVSVDGTLVTSQDTHHMSGYFPGSYKDERDVDQDGDVNESFAAASAYYEYTGRYEVLARKYIARETVNNWNKDGLKTGAGAPFRYKLWNYNNLLTNVTSYELLDVLPHPNDFSTAASATSGTLEARQSKFSNTLTGPVRITTPNARKFTVEYSTDVITGEVDQSSHQLTFSDTVADYTKVTAIRVRLNNGETFNKGELLEAELPMKAPEMATLGDRAWNNFSIATNTKQPTPTNLVWNEMYIPSSPLKIVKKSADGVTLLANAVFTVTRVDNPAMTYELTTNRNGEVEQVLPLGTYTVVEKTAPRGYLLDATVRTVEIVEDETTTVEAVNVPLISITTHKIWNDDDNRDGKRPENIQVRLLANGVEKQTVSLSQTENWTHTFVDLPAYENGQKIVYTVTEDAVADYETTIDGFTITNRHVPEVKNITVNKVWQDNDNQDGKRPETINIRLFANGEERELATLTSEDNWTHTFEYLPVYDEGQEITYTITEEEVDGYETTIDGYTVTNTHTPEVKSVTVNKVWQDNDNQDGKRPESIQVRLLANGVEKQTALLSQAENWAHTFANLPVYENGEAIVYTVTEDAVSEYETTIDGYTITNRHTPEVKSVTVNKVWQDNDNQDGKRPETIHVRLLANGVEKQTVSISQTENWTHTFGNLPVYENGEEIAYTVTEDAVADYETTIDGYTITNSYTPEVKSVTVNKVWQDNDDKDGKRPEKITVHLLANGQIVRTQDITKEMDWTYTFADLPVYTNGKTVEYSIKEDAVASYSSVVDEFNVTNTLIETPDMSAPTPDEETPEKPTPPSPNETLEKPTPPSPTETPDVPTTPDEPTVPSKPKALPNTGSQHDMTVIGLSILLIGLAGLIYDKKRLHK